MKHFPFIPKLRRMYRAPNILKLMQWHQANISQDGFVFHVVDSKTWTHIDSSWPNFASDPCNVKLGLALDGVNPFENQFTTWSTWPFILLNYNLPPWLTIKNSFLDTYIVDPKQRSNE